MAEYPTITVRNTQTQSKRIGWLIGNDLVVSKSGNSWEIWNRQGCTLFRNIDTSHDAIKIAEWLDSIYSSYFLMWAEYPEMDVFSVTKWGVDNGTKIYETIEKMRKMPRIYFYEVQKVLAQATGRMYYQHYMKEYQEGEVR